MQDIRNKELQKQEIELNKESGDPYFETKTMIAVKSNKNKSNILVGEYVIIPKSQVSSPFEMTNEEWADTKVLLDLVKEYLDKTYHPDGYNIGWNVGTVAGQNVHHAHMHIIPRYADEPYAGRGIRYLFKQPENIRTSLREDK